jgi:hypothetical protein
MYVRYLPEFLLMIAEEDVVNKLVKTRRLIQEQEACPRQSPDGGPRGLSPLEAMGV